MVSTGCKRLKLLEKKDLWFRQALLRAPIGVLLYGIITNEPSD